MEVEGRKRRQDNRADEADWRELRLVEGKFTLSPEMSRVVREAFVRLYEEKLIYRAHYLTNWCPVCLTVLSDLEVVHEERQGHLWHIKYPVADADGDISGGAAANFLVVAIRDRKPCWGIRRSRYIPKTNGIKI